MNRGRQAAGLHDGPLRREDVAGPDGEERDFDVTVDVLAAGASAGGMMAAQTAAGSEVTTARLPWPCQPLYVPRGPIRWVMLSRIQR